MKKFLYINKLTFTYPNCVEPLFNSVSFQLQPGWTGVVGANGSGKSTLLKLVCGLLTPESNKLNIPTNSYYCEQRTDTMPYEFDKLLESVDKYHYRIKNALQIQDEWQNRWESLSHGERKRCQIAVALFKNPDLLAIDEPSNHLDYYAKKIIFDALKLFKGIGLMVSHDREFLDTLCQHTLFIFPPDIEMRRCPYSIATMEIERERNYQNFCYVLAKKEVKKLKMKVTKQRAKAQISDARLSKRNLDAKDHDTKSKKDLARYSGKDGIEGQTHRRLKSRLEKTQTKQDTIRFVKKKTLGISIKENRQSKNFPIIINPTEISLGENKILRLPELIIQKNEKIGIVGDNGSGKSTFVNYFIESSKIAMKQIVYIPQEIPVEKSKLIVKKIQNYSDIELGQMMTLISRLGSDPTHVLETELPSPGEVRKLMLAKGIIKNPGLIIMDEPTNHMDLPSIQCIETALNECACALLLVSHDLIFLQNTVHYFWYFQKSKNNYYQVIQTNEMTGL